MHAILWASGMLLGVITSNMLNLCLFDMQLPLLLYSQLLFIENRIFVKTILRIDNAMVLALYHFKPKKKRKFSRPHPLRLLAG